MDPLGKTSVTVFPIWEGVNITTHSYQSLKYDSHILNAGDSSTGKGFIGFVQWAVAKKILFL